MRVQRDTPSGWQQITGEARSIDASYNRAPLAGNSSEILKSAARHALLAWRQRIGDPPAGPEVSDLLVVLAASIVETQITAAPVIDERIRSDIGRRLLDLLRAEVVKRWANSGVVDADVPTILLAIERVREALEPTAAEAFASQLADAGGMALLTDVAHDLRSPLTSILFLAETLQRGQSGAVSDIQRRQLGLIYTAALGLSSVASDIIDLSRSDQLVEPAPIPFSVAGVLESVHDIVRPMVDEKQLAMRVQHPTMDERLGHPVALSRVLLNLTTNALKFTDTGYVEIATREVLNRRVEFSVRDSGKGIDPAIVATLFSPTRPTAGPTRTGRGARLFSRTGLGLTICRKLVRTMGSELYVETRPEWGTRFYFELDLPVYSSPRRTPVP
jgi:signal transduction histidine kinase